MIYRYYLIHRPVMIGTVPRGMVGYKNFNHMISVDEIGRTAWGYVEYDRELTEKEISEYELVKE